MQQLFTPAFTNPAGSPIRELFPYLSRPGMISFAGGYPSADLFDVQGLQGAVARALATLPECLQYGATEGSATLKDELARLCASRGIRRPASDILVTAGSQQGFDLLLRVFIEPGDVVLVETPAYPAAIQALRLAGAVIEEAPIDGGGLDTERLQLALRARAPGKSPRLLYTVPSFSNPSGTLMRAARREELVKLALQYGFRIVEDDPYGELAFGTELQEPVWVHGERHAGDDNPVVYLSSLSKTVAPALRIGWMVASQPVLRRCAIAKQTVDLCTSPLAQLVAAEYLRSDRYSAAVARARQEYRRRAETMVDALSATLPFELSFVRPEGGMFLWAVRRLGIEPQRLFAAAVDCGVLFVPGSAFHPHSVRPDTMRLSFAAPGVDQIRTGVARLAQAFRQASAS